METLKLKLPVSFKSFLISGSEHDTSIMGAIKRSKYYEPHMVRCLRSHLKKDAVCLDIGANIGVLSLYLGYYAPMGKVYAFEASERNYKYFLQNIEQNDIKNIEPLLLGIYDKKCSMEIQYIDEFAGGAFMNTTGAYDPRSVQETIHCVSLDEWMEEQKLTRLDIIKLDIEGAEMKAIDGAEKTLKKFRPDLVIEYNEVTMKTFFNVSPEEFFERLRGLFPSVMRINRRNGKLMAIENFEMLQKSAKTYGGLEDLYCSFRT